jgi:hypothetical protein
MMEFARRYCLNNPNVFSSSDTAYVLAYSLIMLNTDAHNPNVKKKMSLQDFLRNNRGQLTVPVFTLLTRLGIDNKQDLPQEFLKKLYMNISKNEIKMNEHDNVFQIQEICLQIQGKLTVHRTHHYTIISSHLERCPPTPALHPRVQCTTSPRPIQTKHPPPRTHHLPLQRPPHHHKTTVDATSTHIRPTERVHGHCIHPQYLLTPPHCKQVPATIHLQPHFNGHHRPLHHSTPPCRGTL